MLNFQEILSLMFKIPKITLRQLVKYTVIIWIIKISLLLTIYGIGLIYLDTIGPLPEDKVIIIEKGSSSWQVSKQLGEAHVIKHDWFFWLLSNITLKARDFKAGEYEFKKKTSPKEVIRIISNGLIVIHKLVVPEGLTNKESISLIESQSALAGNIVDTYPEGYLMGNTYYYTYGDRRQMIADKMHSDAVKFIDSQWEKRDPKIPLKDKNEAVILASIIEKEAILPQEQSIIAGVFYNRLRKNMKLQADPTIIYAITLGQSKFDRKITKEDIRASSVYNTYHIVGLPPTPIANPSKGAIIAALHPASHQYLYFVTNGKRGHNFSSNLSQHNDHVSNYKKMVKNAPTNK